MTWSIVALPQMISLKERQASPSAVCLLNKKHANNAALLKR